MILVKINGDIVKFSYRCKFLNQKRNIYLYIVWYIQAFIFVLKTLQFVLQCVKFGCTFYFGTNGVILFDV